jgi:hypothetical protein
MSTNREKHYEAWETRRRIAGRKGLRGVLLIVAVVAAIVAAVVAALVVAGVWP